MKETEIFFNASGPSHGKVVVCYLGTWSVYRLGRGSFTIEHLDPTLCTHIVYSFAGLDEKTDSIKSLGRKNRGCESGVQLVGFRSVSGLS